MRPRLGNPGAGAKRQTQTQTESSTAPLVLKMGEKEYIATGNEHGHVLVRDQSLEVVGNLEGGKGKLGSALATWEDGDKVRWMVAARGNNLVGIKVTGDRGKLKLEEAWTSREMVSPAAPIVVNGVVFGLSSGSRTAPAVLYALNGATGKELWSSGKSIATYSTTALSAGASKIYVGTHDGTMYAFGYLLPRD